MLLTAFDTAVVFGRFLFARSMQHDDDDDDKATHAAAAAAAANNGQR